MSSSTTQPVQLSLFTSERGENKGRIWQQHLDWTAKQGRILTDSGNALQYYCEENGFPFSHEELPHYHVERGDSNYVFRKWSQEAIQRQENPTQKYAVDVAEGVSATTLHVSPIIGVWKRPLFTGKWEHSTEDDEIVYNVQTGTLFVDLRIPRSKSLLKWDMLGEGTTRNHITAGNSHHNSRQILESMSDDDLRLYARQHVFGGFSVLTMEDAKTNKGLPICTRHHCIDWNYIPGKPRPRPNKWFIEGKNNGALPFEVWKEWSYATDENSQCYYWERWERIIGDEMGKGLRLALRKRNQNKEDGIHTDGILVVVGDHFNYITGRQLANDETKYPPAKSLVELVDCAIGNGDRQTAISYLTLDGGHGTISSGWKIDCAIQPWRHGKRVFDCISRSSNESSAKTLAIKVAGEGADFFKWGVIIGETVWDVYESSVRSANDLETLLSKHSMFQYNEQNSRL